MSEAFRAGLKAGAEWAKMGRALSLNYPDAVGVVTWLVGQPVGHPEAITWLRSIGAPEGHEEEFANGMAEGSFRARKKMRTGR